MASAAIEKNVPVPAVKTRGAKYPWREMEVGDSILVPIGDRYPSAVQQSLSYCARRVFGKGNSTTRREGDGIRIWRLA